MTEQWPNIQFVLRIKNWICIFYINFVNWISYFSDSESNFLIKWGKWKEQLNPKNTHFFLPLCLQNLPEVHRFPFLISPSASILFYLFIFVKSWILPSNSLFFSNIHLFSANIFIPNCIKISLEKFELNDYPPFYPTVPWHLVKANRLVPHWLLHVYEFEALPSRWLTASQALRIRSDLLFKLIFKKFSQFVT